MSDVTSATLTRLSSSHSRCKHNQHDCQCAALSAQIASLRCAMLFEYIEPKEADYNIQKTVIVCALYTANDVVIELFSKLDMNLFVDEIFYTLAYHLSISGKDDLTLLCNNSGIDRGVIDGLIAEGLPNIILPDAIANLIAVVAKRSNCVKDQIPDYIAELNSEHFVSRDGSKTVVCCESHDITLNRSSLIRTSFTDFRNFYCNRKVITAKDKNGNSVYMPIGAAWLKHPDRRQYKGIVMSPMVDVVDHYNLWRGFAVKSVNGSWKLMQKHIFEVICDSNDTVFQYLMGWMARMIQQPGKTGEVAIVLQGGRGTGKGMFGNALCHILGQHACHVTNGRHVTGNFNAHLEDCIFLFADEAFWAGDKQAENVLKGLITEPEIPIERKGFDLRTVPNMLHMLMASNNDWVVPAGTDERRYCVLKVSNCYAQNHKYFADLEHETINGGLEAMLYDLQQYDISAFNVRGVPNTAGLIEQKIQSLEPMMAWWHQKLQEGELLPGYEWGCVPFPQLYEDYITCIQKLSGQIRRLGETAFAIQIRKALPKTWPKVSKCVPKNAPYGNSNRVKHNEFPELRVCREQFEKLLGDTLEWADSDNDPGPAPF